MRRVRFIGVGSFVPRRVISNERIANAIPGWPPERITEKLGLTERRFLWDFDDATGKAIPPPEDADFYPSNNSQMSTVALERALARAGIPASELDGLFVVTCSPDQLNFNHDAMQVHRALSMRPDAFALVIDDGCGGTPYLIDLARKLLEGGALRTIAVVASSFTSPYVNREIFTASMEVGDRELSGFLSMYVFGDGASAVVLRGEDGEEESAGIVRSMAGNGHQTLVHHASGGALRLPFQGRSTAAEQAFIVDGIKVARSYPTYMKACLDAVLLGDRDLQAAVKRYYFHQPNKRLLDHFAAQLELPPEKVACLVDRQGNTSAAGMMTLLDDDLEQGRVRLGSGDLVLIAAVGANVHYGAQLVRL